MAMHRSRRRFLKYLAAGTGTAVGGFAWWVAVSKQRTARWLRLLIADARRTVSPPPLKPAPHRWSDDEFTLAWLGHATVLINFYGIYILTDPALASHVGISLGFGTAGPKRYVLPALLPG